MTSFVFLSFYVTVWPLGLGAQTTIKKKLMGDLTLRLILFMAFVLLTKNMPVFSRVQRHNRGGTSAGTLVYPAHTLLSIISAPLLVQMQLSKQHFKIITKNLVHNFV